MAKGLKTYHFIITGLNQHGDKSDLAQYSLGVQLAQHNKFTFPIEKPQSQLEIFDWALHFDASLFAKLMKEFSLKNKVELIDNKVERVKLSPSNGDIETLCFSDNREISADLFIDCSGFKGLLISEALNVGYHDWSEWLVCDRAIALQTEASDLPITRTISHAQKAGWLWHIPLQHRTGNGHVYSSQYISDDEALDTLQQSIQGKALHQPRQFSFTPGRRKQAWAKNCIAIGLSSGFIEPLESTSIALVETAIEKVILSFQQTRYNQQTIDRFNEVTALEYERVRDFIILHYKVNQREDSPMWQHCREMTLPTELNEKMREFKEHGKIIRYPWEIFGADSWLAIFNGMNYLPNSYDKRVDNMELSYLHDNLAYMKNRVQQAVNSIPSHSDFLKHHCGFKVKN